MNKKMLLILILVIVLVLGGAYVLYDRLAPSLTADSLATYTAESSTQASAETTEAPTETTQEPTGSAEASTEVPTASTEAPDLTAPDFTVYDIEGNEVHLSDYFGKPIVLNFWASWCGPCKMEMPDFNEVCAELDGQVQFLMVNMTDGSRETVESASEFIASQGFTFPVFYDTDYDAALVYQAYSLPTTYFISAEGQLVAKATGAIDRETLLRGIGMIAS